MKATALIARFLERTRKVYDFAAARINTTVVFFFIYSFFLISPFLYGSTGVIMAHDYPFHHNIVYQLGLAFDGGQFPARIMPGMAAGWGLGTGIFYPPLSHFTAYLINLLPFFNINTAIIAVYFLGYFFSGFAFYKMMKFLGRTESAAAVGGLLYMSLPYHIINATYRGAYGEAFCFMFLPLVLMGVVKLVREQKILLLVLSFSGLVLSHNITALYTLIFIALGCLVYYKSFLKKEVIVACLKAAALVLLLTCFFTVPLIEHTLFGSDYMFQSYGDNLKNLVVNSGLTIANLFYWPFGQDEIQQSWLASANLQGRMPLFVGMHLLLLFVGAVVWPSSKENGRSDFPFILGALFALFATTVYFPWGVMPYIFQYIQYPWRILMFAGFFICVVAADMFSDMSTKGVRFALVVLACVGAFYTAKIASPLSIAHDTSDWSQLSKHDIMRNIGGENFPARGFWHLRNNFDKKIAPSSINGHSVISEFKHENNGQMSFNINAKSDNCDEIELPLFYYMGYEIKFVPKNGGAGIVIPYVEDGHGFVSVQTCGSGLIKAGYKGTVSDRIATIISFLTLVLIGGLMFKRRGLR